MDTKALKLAARFSLAPNILGYCGRKNAFKIFKDCIINSKCNAVKRELESFIVLDPYLETLSKITGYDKFSYSNIEAYWLGNKNLKKAKEKDYKLLISNFRKKKVPEFFLKELKSKVPKKFIPFHLFQVLYIGVGKASGSVPYNMDSINNCMVRWGKVEKKEKDYLTINLNSLMKRGKKYNLILKKGRYTYRPEFLPNLKLGDTVAVHWREVVKKLTKEEVRKIEYWTKQVIKLAPII